MPLLVKMAPDTLDSRSDRCDLSCVLLSTTLIHNASSLPLGLGPALSLHYIR